MSTLTSPAPLVPAAPRARRTPLTTLSAGDCETFIRDGILPLRAAIPAVDLEPMRAAIWQRLGMNGHRREDPATWAGASGMHMRRITHHPAFTRIASPRLVGAIDDLVGAGRWQRPSSWGQFAITMPQSGPAWEPTSSAWHSDCSPVNSQHSGLFVLILLADVVPGGGGTLLVASSHRALARDFARLTPPEVARKARVHRERFNSSHPWLAQLNGLAPVPGSRTEYFAAPSAEHAPGERFQLMEAHGQAGDAYLCHPFTYHAGSLNRSSAPRLMRIKMLPLAPGESRDDPLSEHPLALSLRANPAG